MSAAVALARRRAWARDAWVPPVLIALLVVTALLYVVSLGASGWANAFYAAAVQAGTHSWKAFFFGSFDSSNFITVDKPPLSLWVMGLSARVFGLSSWSLLAPQALEGVAAVWLLFATVRRRFGAGAGLLAGLALALTPVATLMFRFDNPDALLVLILVAAAYALTRALEDGSTRWMVACGALVGLGFMTKMLQAFLVVPAFAVAYLACAPLPLRRRLGRLLAGGAALVVASGWWVAIVTLWPAGDRPYIGGSQHNSVLELIFGYNGFGRLTGNESGSVGGFAGPGGGGGRWGSTGITRLFGEQMGTQISWLLPAALILLVALAWMLRRDEGRSAVLMWGGWLVVTGLVFSLAQGIIHPYYTVALAPAVAALSGIGAAMLWRGRSHSAARATLSLALAATAVWSYVLLDRTPDWLPWLRFLVLAGGLLTALMLLPHPATPPIALAAAAVGLTLAGPLAYSIATAAQPQTGAIPSAGPPAADRAAAGRFAPRFRGRGFRLLPGGSTAGRGGAPLLPPGAGAGAGAGPSARGAFPALAGAASFAHGGGPPGAGALLDAGRPSAALVSLLKRGSAGFTWVAATVGANSAAGIQLAVDHPVMAIGGFNGTDPTPSLPRFRALVRAHAIHYFLASAGPPTRLLRATATFAGRAGRRRGFAAPGRSGDGGRIAAWVQGRYARQTVAGLTLYDLTRPLR